MELLNVYASHQYFHLNFIQNPLATLVVAGLKILVVF